MDNIPLTQQLRRPRRNPSFPVVRLFISLISKLFSTSPSNIKALTKTKMNPSYNRYANHKAFCKHSPTLFHAPLLCLSKSQDSPKDGRHPSGPYGAVLPEPSWNTSSKLCASHSPSPSSLTTISSETLAKTATGTQPRSV